LFLRTESYAERVTGSAENTWFFGTYDSTANLDDFSEAVDEVKT
jgi:hypothetical protein